MNYMKNIKKMEQEQKKTGREKLERENEVITYEDYVCILILELLIFYLNHNPLFSFDLGYFE